MNTIKNLEVIATAARADFESQHIDRVLLRELYVMYAQVADVSYFLDQAAQRFPEGNCGLASVYLQHVIGDGDVRYGRYSGLGHTILVVSGVGVDITADQFGGPRVFVGGLAEPYDKASYGIY